MKIKKILKSSVLFVLLSFFISSTIFAETTNVKIAPAQAVVLASVDIKEARIVSQKGNIFNISFSFLNRGSLQTGVKYGVKLVSESKTGQMIIDEKVYDESLTLNSNMEVKKDIVYIAPSLLSGSYTLMLTSSNSSGFPFEFINLGKVALSATYSGIQILPETCKLKSFSLNQKIEVNLGETLSLSCEALNSSKEEVTATPFYEVRLRTSFGEVINQNGGSIDPIIFKAGEKKSFSVTLPKATNPQLYNINFTLNNKDNKSNVINFNYIVLGTSATIYNLSLDKDYYNKGDAALVSLVAISNSSSAITSNIQISNGKGKSCAKPQIETLTSPISPKVDSSIAITSSCFNPKISVSLIDEKGTVLAQKEFNVKTTSVVSPKASYSTIVWIIAIILILIVIILFLYFKKKKNTIPTNNIDNITKQSNSVPMGVIFFFLLIASFGMIPTHLVKAGDTVTVSGTTKYAVVSIDKTTYYYPGDNVNGTAALYDTVTGQMTSGTVEDSVPDASAERAGLYPLNDSYHGLPIPNVAGSHNATFYISIYKDTTSYTTSPTYTPCQYTGVGCSDGSTNYYQQNADGTYTSYSTGGSSPFKYVKTSEGGVTTTTDNYYNVTYSIPFTVVLPPPPLAVTVFAQNISTSSTKSSSNFEVPQNTNVQISWSSTSATHCKCTYYKDAANPNASCGEGVGDPVEGGTVSLAASKTFKVTCDNIPDSVSATATQYWFRLHSCQDASNYETGPYSDYRYSTGDLLAGALDNGTYNYRVIGSATSSYGYNNIGVSKASVITCPY